MKRRRRRRKQPEFPTLSDGDRPEPDQWYNVTFRRSVSIDADGRVRIDQEIGQPLVTFAREVDPPVETPVRFSD